MVKIYRYRLSFNAQPLNATTRIDRCISTDPKGEGKKRNHDKYQRF